MDPFTKIALAFAVFWFLYITFAAKKDNVSTTAKARVNPALIKLFVLIFTVFAGCFIFPISSPQSPLSIGKALLLIGAYGTIALAMAALYGPTKKKLIYPAVLVLTAAGIVCRYVFEFEELLGEADFTFGSVVAYIAVIPAATALLYYLLIKVFQKMK